MGNIIFIFQRAFPFLVFILLQSIAFYIIFKYNDYHQSNFISRSNYLAASFNEKLSSLTSFVNMPKHNESLIKENAKLREEIYKISKFINTIRGDSTGEKIGILLPPSTRVVSGKVVSNSIASLRNYVIVNKGIKDGIKKDMSAISNLGPVGIVIEVTENYCCIMSILNKDANVSVRNRSTKNVGQLRWKGGDIKTALLEEIPKHIKLKKGEIIETSGYSSYYPEGIPVGTVEKYSEDSKSNFANIQVKLYSDFSKLKYVYLIENIERPEIRSLEDTIIKIQKQEN
ncbi:MAG: rod shape-determining protein MreC [Chitinophagales bacterium]|nr:rod shape-determining protein MreC [Chitinophagales bacterium]